MWPNEGASASSESIVFPHRVSLFSLSLLVQKLYTLGCLTKGRRNFKISILEKMSFSAGNLHFCGVAKLAMERDPREF